MMIKLKLMEILENSGYERGDVDELFSVLDMSQSEILNKLKSDVEDRL